MGGWCPKTLHRLRIREVVLDLQKEKEKRKRI